MKKNALLWVCIWMLLGVLLVWIKYSHEKLTIDEVACETLSLSTTYCLPVRIWSPPATSEAPMNTNIAHQQTTQNAPVSLQEILFNQVVSFSGVTTGPSRVSVAWARAFFVDENMMQNPWISAGEFAHLHPSYDWSLHLVLPDTIKHKIVQLWRGELHPRNPTTIMIYWPRNEEELEHIIEIVRVSYSHVLWLD